MGLPVLKVESQNELSDDERKAERVASRARLRIGELLHRPFDVRSIALTGLFILAVFYTIYFMRSVLLPIVLALLLSYLFEADSARTRSIENSAAGERGVHSYRTFCGCWLWNFSAGHARGGMDSEGTARFDGTATQAATDKKIRSSSEPDYQRNREACFN